MVTAKNLEISAIRPAFLLMKWQRESAHLQKLLEPQQTDHYIRREQISAIHSGEIYERYRTISNRMSRLVHLPEQIHSVG